MLRWIGRIFIGLFLFAVIAGAAVFTHSPDFFFRRGTMFVQTYRSGITGDLTIKDGGYWLPVAPGVERRIVRVTRGGGKSLDLYSLRFNPRKVTLKVVYTPPKEVAGSSIAVTAEKTKAVAMFNGSYFNDSLGVLGLCVADGKTVAPLARYSDNLGIFLAHASGAVELIHRDKYNAGDVLDAVQSGPWLVLDGKVQVFNDTDRVTRRTCIGADKRGRLVAVATDTLISGITLAHLAKVMAEPLKNGGFECASALNLDGGTSTQLILRTSDENHLIRGFVNVPVLIGAYPKRP